VKYIVELTSEAERDLNRLDRTSERRIRERVKELAPDLYSPRLSKPLKMFPGIRTARVGDWRVLYEIAEPESD
jgi:mRNA-degrading endonuclease RelE of RelBE toxin-antitoxin system